MKIKLPRKRKKRYISVHGSIGYMSMQIANEVMFENEPVKKSTRFPEFLIDARRQIKILFNY